MHRVGTMVAFVAVGMALSASSAFLAVILLEARSGVSVNVVPGDTEGESRNPQGLLGLSERLNEFGDRLDHLVGRLELYSGRVAGAAGSAEDESAKRISTSRIVPVKETVDRLEGLLQEFKNVIELRGHFAESQLVSKQFLDAVSGSDGANVQEIERFRDEFKGSMQRASKAILFMPAIAILRKFGKPDSLHLVNGGGVRWVYRKKGSQILGIIMIGGVAMSAEL